MIKFAGHIGEGRRLVGFGLSRGNCERLLKGQPIRIDVSKLIPGFNIDVLIFGGDTEAEMMNELRKFGQIGPDTKINPNEPYSGPSKSAEMQDE